MTDLRAFFQQAPVVEFRGLVHRICISVYRHGTLSMRGAWTRGARYNIRNYFGALYTSLELETARAEMRRYFTIPPDCGFVSAVASVHLSRVVDLTNPKSIRHVGLRRMDLAGSSYAVCQEFGLRAWESGLEGLLVPSAGIRGARNLVLFLDNQHPRWSMHLRSVTPAPTLPQTHVK